MSASPTILPVATVRVQLTDSAESADFAVIDDVDSAEANACEANPATRMVAISGSAAGVPVIYLSRRGAGRCTDLRPLEDVFRA